MSPNYRSILVAVLVSVVPLVTYARSLECHGNIISPGDTEQQLLEVCGEPTSRDGANWIYERPGSIPAMVTLGNGVVMFIGDADEEKALTTHPLGDRP